MAFDLTVLSGSVIGTSVVFKIFDVLLKLTTFSNHDNNQVKEMAVEK